MKDDTLTKVAAALAAPVRLLPKRQTEAANLGILIVVSDPHQASEMQKAFDERVVRITHVGGSLMGYRVRAIFVATDAYVRRHCDSVMTMKSYYQYLDHIRCRLAAGCTGNFFHI